MVKLILMRQPGQGGVADHQVRDLRSQLLQAEAAHFSKTNGDNLSAPASDTATGAKRQLEDANRLGDEQDEDLDTKRRRVLEATRDIDADSNSSGSGSSEEER